MTSRPNEPNEDPQANSVTPHNDPGRKELLEKIINHEILDRGNSGHMYLGAPNKHWSPRDYPDRLSWMTDDPVENDVNPSTTGGRDNLIRLRSEFEGVLLLRKYRPAGKGPNDYFNDLYGAVKAKIDWAHDEGGLHGAVMVLQALHAAAIADDMTWAEVKNLIGQPDCNNDSQPVPDNAVWAAIDTADPDGRMKAAGVWQHYREMHCVDALLLSQHNGY